MTIPFKYSVLTCRCTTVIVQQEIYFQSRKKNVQLTASYKSTSTLQVHAYDLGRTTFMISSYSFFIDSFFSLFS